ncbi:MAG: DciA family protein [Sulfuriferula sp.]
MRPTQPARQANVFLTENDKLRLLSTQVQTLLGLQRIWEAVAPANLAGVSHIGQDEFGQTTLYCDNGAVAAKLRQQLSTLAETLRSKGVATTNLQVKVRAQALPVPARTVQKREISRAGLDNIAQLSDRLETGELKSALDHLLARHHRN